jgi:hypothetical protein
MKMENNSGNENTIVLLGEQVLCLKIYSNVQLFSGLWLILF